VGGVTDLFSHLCGQGRCFIVDGAALPVCQRCFGLYAGATLTAGWLLLARTWRCGLPNRRPGWVEGIALFVAMLGGLHVFDIGPAWRLTCGLWTGHVVMLWLVGASVQFRQLSQPGGPALRTWSRRQNLQALLAAPFLALAAVAFTAGPPANWYIWTVLTIVGALCLLVAMLMALASVGMRLAYLGRRSETSRS
jgi:hypothetical protein